MQQPEGIEVYTHKKFGHSLYVHKKFGSIKLEKEQKRKATCTWNDNKNRTSVEILEVLVMNAPKRVKLTENSKPVVSCANGQQQLYKSSAKGLTVNTVRSLKEVRIAPQPSNTAQISTSTSTNTSIYSEYSDVNAMITATQQKLTTLPTSTSIVTPIAVSTISLSPQLACVAPVMPMASRTPDTSGKPTSASHIPTAAPTAYFNQRPPLSPTYGGPNSYWHSAHPPTLQPYYGWYSAQSTMQQTFTTPQRQTPMFYYTQLLQRQMHAMTQRQSVFGKSQISTVV